MKTSNKLLTGLIGFIIGGILLFILMGRFSMTSFAMNTVKGNGELSEISRTVAAFDGLKVGSGIKVNLSKGDNSVNLQGESNLLELIETTVKDGILTIRWKSGTSVDKNHPIKAKVTMPRMEYLSASSSATIETADNFEGGKIHFYASSGSTVRLQGLATESLAMDCSSSSTVRFAQAVSSADAIEIDLSSGSELYFTALSGGTVEVDMSSSSVLSMSGSATTLIAKGLSGSELKGAAFAVQEARFDGSSSASFEVEVSDNLKANLSSGSTVRYRGEARVSESLSSGASVRKVD